MANRDLQRFSSHLCCQGLTGLTLEHLPKDDSLGRVRLYRKGADIWRPDDRADRIYFLRRGQIVVMSGDSEGNEVIMQVIEKGEPFGELCFYSQEKGLRHTTARAVVESEVHEVKHRDFVSYLQKSTNALMDFTFTLCERLSEMSLRVGVLAHRGAEERLGRLLLQLAAPPGQQHTEGTNQVTLHVGHEELAKMAAMNRSHVSVTMGKLRRRGLVRYERNRPLVVDVPGLTAYLTDS
ncbi:MAG: Crp/Fnr family transcriptional regulator [Acidobacteria bacterium]|nr:Crp/Fnr family transcriptional regulator [Acidobacteriota bacterium]